MSLINPLTGQTESLEPAKLGGSTVVEVGLERLDASKGEDFGWERVASADGVRAQSPVIRGAGPAAAPALGGRARFVAAPKVARANELLAAGRHAELVSSGLVDVLRGFFELWDGTVTLPEDPSPEARFRLVVTEYEEYLVDDDRPYDRVPTRKGRRLVFVEHVELT